MINENLRPSQPPSAAEAAPSTPQAPEAPRPPETIESLRAQMAEQRKEMAALSTALFERGMTYEFEGLTEKALASLIATEEELDEYGMFPDHMVRHAVLIPAFEGQNVALDIGDGPTDGNLSAVPADIHRSGDRHQIIAHSIPLRDLKATEKTDPALRAAIELYTKYNERTTALKALEKAKK